MAMVLVVAVMLVMVSVMVAMVEGFMVVTMLDVVSVVDVG